MTTCLCPMTTWPHSSTPADSLRVSILRWRQSPTHDNPTTTALSLSANACVELPSTSLSLWSQLISSMHGAVSVREGGESGQVLHYHF